MVYYTNCFFCCKSKTGGKVLAILGIVYNAIAILVGSIFYGVYSDTLHEYQLRKNSDLDFGIRTTIIRNIDAIVGVYIVVCLTWITLCALLLHGINKKKKDFLLPFMIFKMIGLVVSKIRLDYAKKYQFLFSLGGHHWSFCKCYHDNQICGVCTHYFALLLALCSIFGLWILLLGCGVFGVSRPRKGRKWNCNANETQKRSLIQSSRLREMSGVCSDYYDILYHYILSSLSLFVSSLSCEVHSVNCDLQDEESRKNMNYCTFNFRW